MYDKYLQMKQLRENLTHYIKEHLKYLIKKTIAYHHCHILDTYYHLHLNF